MSTDKDLYGKSLNEYLIQINEEDNRKMNRLIDLQARDVFKDIDYKIADIEIGEEYCTCDLCKNSND